ncbi:unnamed protein product [Moneuplotes crassus]|uniref:Protein kinase domain-containing protein n=1 Tax=Euplotes crassus TaxID=5936 RepID=A0AAD2D809_EUPCR|nr:unnamed protein product [Moneuplotes crassus]
MLSKVFTFNKASEESKSSSTESEEESSEDKIWEMSSPYLESDASKVLTLDLSYLLKDGNLKGIDKEETQIEIKLFDDCLTTGWLVCEVMRKYTDFIQELENKTGSKLKKKLVVAIKVYEDYNSSDEQGSLAVYNESLNYWVTQVERSLEPLQTGQRIVPHFSKYLPNRKKPICLNDFILEKVIGKGGFSKVFLVRKKSSGFMYAMKVLDKNMATDQRKLKQIENERKIMQITNHPFIVKLYWAFQTYTTLNFVMDLCVGGELFYQLKLHRRLDEFKAKFYIIELILAFEYLHSKNIVYRDLKPENVLIDIDGHIKLADFGLSKQLKTSHSRSFCGSPEYMSPEMLRGESHDLRLDLYCLGALLFEMLTGLPPHYNQDTNKMYQGILENRIEFPFYVPIEACDLMEKLLQKSCSDRPQSIEEVKNHEYFNHVNWDDYFNKRIEVPWKPNLIDSNFDSEYTSLPINFNDFGLDPKNDSRRGKEFWVEGLSDAQLESYSSSKTVTEQSFSQSYLEQDISLQNAEFMIPKDLSGVENDYPRNRGDSSMNFSRISNNVEKSQGIIKVKRFSYQLEPEQEKEVHRQINQYLKAKRTKAYMNEAATPELRLVSEQKLSEVFENNEFGNNSEQNSVNTSDQITMVKRSKTTVVNFDNQEEVKIEYNLHDESVQSIAQEFIDIDTESINTIGKVRHKPCKINLPTPYKKPSVGEKKTSQLINPLALYPSKSVSKPNKKIDKAFDKSNFCENESTRTDNKHQVESFSSQKYIKSAKNSCYSSKKPKSRKIFKVERTYSNQVSPAMKKTNSNYYECSRKISQKSTLSSSLIKFKKNKRQSEKFECRKNYEKLIL